MNFKEEHIEIFRRYLDGDLSKEEVNAFEKQLSEDEEFKRSFDAFGSFEKAIKASEVVETYDRVGGWESNYKTPKKQAPIRKLMIAVTSVAAVAALVFFLWMPATSNDALVSEYFSPYDNVVTVRGKKEVLDKALNAYDKKKYEQALELFNEFPNDSIGMFYRAESLMALKRYDEAANVYDEVIVTNGIFEEVAMYHKALAYLGANDEGKAKKTLQDIPKSSHYSAQAKDLLERL